MKKHLSLLISNLTHRGGGVNRTNKKLVILVLVILELSLITLAYISYNNKNLDKYIFGSTSIKNNSLFAVMLEDSNGTYKQTDLEEFPGYEYFYNQEKSTCMDLSGKPIENSLLYNQDTRTASITISDTSSCYLYFDKWKDTTFTGESLAESLIQSGDLWQSGLEGDGYRYVGSGAVGTETNPNNFICFGTTDKTECLENPDKYMYRIIGVFQDDKKTNHVKLIKYTQIGSTMWCRGGFISLTKDHYSRCLGSDLNSEYFLANETYNYLQNSAWLNKIKEWNWISLSSELGDFSYLSGTQMYDALNGTNDEDIEKIGLMYASDYLLSLGSEALSLKNSINSNQTKLKTGWLHASNNQKVYSSDWLMDINGYVDGYFWTWFINTTGNLGTDGCGASLAVRPTFYLESNVTAEYGNGTINNPFIITDSDVLTTALKVTLSNNDATLNISITKGAGNLSKYCVNTVDSKNGCSWKNISGTSMSYTMPSKNTTYYVFVIDDKGYITKGKFYYYVPSLSDTLIASNKMYQSGLDGDGYRFVGTGAYNSSTTPSNFVCFGTTSKSDCTSNPDKYMYRIIGVFNNQVKLIKLTSLTSNIQYAGTTFTQMSENYRIFASSSIKRLLNGTEFLTNTTYDYMQNTKWTNIISENSKNSVNTSTYNSGPNYYNSLTPKQIYLHENNKDGKSSTVGYWGDYTDKIAVMDASDYVLSLGSTAVNMTSGTYSNRNTLKTSWIFLGNNKYGNTTGNYTTEHTTAFYGKASSNSYIYSWTINPSGYLYYTLMNTEYAVRPVFYLNSDVPSSSGTGTLSDPYILKN